MMFNISNSGMSLKAFLLLVALFCFTNGTPCGVTINGELIASSNLCKNETGKPFCINLSGDWDRNAQPNFACSACAHNCDCPIGQYCIKTPGPNRGTCSKLDVSGTILGKSCNSFDSAYTADKPVLPTKGVNDHLVCGIPIFLNDTFMEYEWLGYCQWGKCKQCTTWGPELEQTISLIGIHDPSLLLCPGYDCYAGELGLSEYAVDGGAESLNIINNIDLPTGIDGAILFFVIIIVLSNLVMCFCMIRRRFDPKNYKKVVQML